MIHRLASIKRRVDHVLPAGHALPLVLVEHRVGRHQPVQRFAELERFHHHLEEAELRLAELRVHRVPGAVDLLPRVVDVRHLGQVHVHVAEPAGERPAPQVLQLLAGGVETEFLSLAQVLPDHLEALAVRPHGVAEPEVMQVLQGVQQVQHHRAHVQAQVAGIQRLGHALERQVVVAGRVACPFPHLLHRARCVVVGLLNLPHQPAVCQLQRSLTDRPACGAVPRLLR